MKLVGINVEVLRSRRDELMAEIEQINSILCIADGDKTYLGVEVRESNGTKGYTYHQGNRKVFLLGLLALNGSAVVDSLAKQVGWSVSDCAIVARGAIRDGLVTEVSSLGMGGQPDRYTLTESGRQAANWHGQHPSYKTYRPAASNAELRRRLGMGSVNHEQK